MKRYCLTVNLKNNPELIQAYEKHHKAVWPEVLQSISDAGITAMEIYRLDTRLVMLLEVNDDFSFEKKAAADAQNPVVQDWETLMWKYQEPLPLAKKGEKWVLMPPLFSWNAGTQESEG